MATLSADPIAADAVRHGQRRAVLCRDDVPVDAEAVRECRDHASFERAIVHDAPPDQPAAVEPSVLSSAKVIFGDRRQFLLGCAS
jgi:hypothetical protein